MYSKIPGYCKESWRAKATACTKFIVPEIPSTMMKSTGIHVAILALIPITEKGNENRMGYHDKATRRILCYCCGQQKGSNAPCQNEACTANPCHHSTTVIKLACLVLYQNCHLKANILDAGSNLTENFNMEVLANYYLVEE